MQHAAPDPTGRGGYSDQPVAHFTGAFGLVSPAYDSATYSLTP
jgi:hypothetical protein